MENQNGNSKLKAVVVVLGVLLTISLAYIFTLTNDKGKLEKTVATVTSEKQAAINQLEDLSAKYDAAIAENTTMTEELKAEKARVDSLLAELKTSKNEAASLRKYKSQYKEMERKVNELMQQVEVLKAENQVLTTNLDSTKVVLEDSRKYNETLVVQNEELAKTVEVGSKLTVLNLKATSYKVRSSGKQIETDKASRIDMIGISFTIAENKIAKSGDKTYYVQVIDAKNNVLGDKATVNFGDKTLAYSFTTNVKYDNKTTVVNEKLMGKDFERGTYYVNIFDKSELVSKSSFTLR